MSKLKRCQKDEIEFENNNNTSGSDMTYLSNRDELKGTGGFNTNDMFVVLMPDPNITSSMIPLDTFTSSDPLAERRCYWIWLRILYCTFK